MPAVGDRIGSYVVTGTIGRGAMASVYRAHDERLNRDVALKVLDQGYSVDFIFRARFEREYGVTARLRGDHNIPVYDAGAWNHQLYIAMMLVDGPNLGEVLKADGQLELSRVVSIVSQIADALDEAHGQRVIHRDVKPANILLTHHGSTGAEHAYLADFGLTLGMEGTHLTRTGGFMGTLAYSSPEQLNSAPIDGRADEYALAATAYHMLAGKPPFRRDNEMALINAHLFDPPPALSESRPDLPSRVGDVLVRGLAKLPRGSLPDGRRVREGVGRRERAGRGRASKRGVCSGHCSTRRQCPRPASRGHAHDRCGSPSRRRPRRRCAGRDAVCERKPGHNSYRLRGSDGHPGGRR